MGYMKRALVLGASGQDGTYLSELLLNKSYRVYALYRTADSGILYNHESPRRKDFFLPKKIVSTAVAIKLGQKTKLQIGDLGAVRDWGYAGDFVHAMWIMLQAEYPRDYIIGQTWRGVLVGWAGGWDSPAKKRALLLKHFWSFPEVWIAIFYIAWANKFMCGVYRKVKYGWLER